MLDLYAEAGGNTIDTAINYRDGASEEFLGELLTGRRESFVLGTKYTVSRDRAAPVDAAFPGVLGDAAGGVDDVELALLAPFVGGDEAPHHGLGRQAFAQQLQSLGAVMRIDERLGRERADPALGVRAQGADGEEARRDRDPERAARGIARDDRPGHGRR